MFIKNFKKLIPQSLKKQYGFLVHPLRTYTIFTARVNPEPIFILGKRKSGTTAIASLLSKISNQPVTIDLCYHIKQSSQANADKLQKVLDRELPFLKFIQRYKFYFSTPLNKCTQLTFFYDELQQCFPQAKFIFIVRDPRDNIRSTLNRRKIAGNLEFLPNPTKYYQIKDLTNKHLAGNHYIEKMAHGWNWAVDQYLSNQNKMILIRYEDFMVNKVAAINNLARQVELNPVHDISAYLDIQYQPRGDRNISWLDFFGENNLNRIETICSERMDYFGYSPST